MLLEHSFGGFHRTATEVNILTVVFQKLLFPQQHLEIMIQLQQKGILRFRHSILMLEHARMSLQSLGEAGLLFT